MIAKLNERGSAAALPHIRRAFREGVALSSWCAGAYQALKTGTGKTSGDQLDPFLKRLDDAAMRGEMPEILRTVLEVHKTQLRAWGAALDRGRNKTSGRMQDLPDPQLRDTRAPTLLRRKSPQTASSNLPTCCCRIWRCSRCPSNRVSCMAVTRSATCWPGSAIRTARPSASAASALAQPGAGLHANGAPGYRRPVQAAFRTIDDHLPAIHAVPHRLRALYGLLRGGFSIGTISRLTALEDPRIDQPYERFRGWLRGVTNAALGWDDAIDKLFLNDDGTPLTVRTDQSLSRLYGVISSPSRRASKKTRERLPRMPARTFYRDDPEGYYDRSLHAAVRRVSLNLAVALIERGQLARAAGILDALRLPNGFSVHGSSQVSWIAEGYLGLIDHLGGNLVVAEHRYAQTIARAQTKGMSRLAAICLRHHADLKRRQHQHPEAKRLIKEAVSISLKSAQRDVYHHCRISQAILALDMDGPREARCQDMVNEAYAYGQTMGIPRLECEALRLQVAILLRQGERMLGGTFASRAAAIAYRHGLRLTVLAALFNYGRALERRGQIAAARQVLSEATREAERCGYQNMLQADIGLPIQSVGAGDVERS